MSRVLLTWELGIGLGHLMNLCPLARELAARGHEVFFAGRDLSQAIRAFGDSRITLLPAPWKCRFTNKVEPVVTFTDLLFNIGFGDKQSLFAYVSAWQSLFKLIKPDLLVCDHSPTALLAACGQNVPRATVGTGFFCPIDESPLRLLRPVSSELALAARDREQQLLDLMNSALQTQSAPPLQRVTEVYYRPGIEHFLLTFPELDHFQNRPDGDYRGVCLAKIGGEPFVVRGREPCLFGYFKPFPGLVDFLGLLGKSRHLALIHVDGWSSAEKARFCTSTLKLSEGPVDMRQATANCFAALTNANAGTCTNMLLAGKPLINVPTQLEQFLFSQATDRLGVSISVRETDAPGILQAVERILADHSYTAAAESFAARHQNDQFSDVARKIVDDLEGLLRN